MHAIDKIKPRAKAAAATAAGALFFANPLIGAFLIGAGIAAYMAFRQRR